MRRQPSHQALRTRDADVALSAAPPVAGDIAAALEAADFKEHLRGEYTPPLAQYQLGGVDAGFYVEFLADLRGDGLTRAGERDATVAWAGVTAQRLRYVKLLLVNPWSVRLDETVGFPLARPADVLIPIAHDLEGLKKEWLERVRPTLTPRTAKQVDRIRRELFSSVSDVIRRASRLPGDRVLKPERVRAACEYGLDEVFGTE